MHAAYNDTSQLIVVPNKPRCSRQRVFIACLLSLFVIVIVIISTLPSSSSPPPIPVSPYSNDPDQRVIEIFRDYLKIKSANPTTGNDALVFLKRIADIYGLEAQRLDFTRGATTRSALLVSRRVTSSLPSLFLLSHIDTVPVELDKWTRDPFGGEMDPETGNIYGRGAQDTKSLTIMEFEALYRLKDVPLNRSIFLFFETNEETGDGTACELQWLDSALWKSLNVGVVFDEGLASGAESDDLQLFYGQRTTTGFTATAHGQAGHGSLMFNNTATMKLIKFLGKVLEVRAEQEALLAERPLGFVTTLNPTLLSGGTTRNVVPSTAQAGIDCRITPGQVQNMSERLKLLAQESDVLLSELENLTEPVLSPHNDSDYWWREITDVLSAYLANTTGGNVIGTIFPAGTSGDCLRDPPYALPVYGFSPLPRTPLLLHDHDEYLNNNTLVEGVAIMQALLKRLAGFEAA